MPRSRSGTTRIGGGIVVLALLSLVTVTTARTLDSVLLGIVVAGL